MRYGTCMRTHVEGFQSTSAEIAGSWSAVSSLVAAVETDLQKWLSATYDIGLTDYRAVAAISRAPDKELRIAVLAERVDLSPTATTRLVSRLEAKSLVYRDTCEDDGRGVFAVITPAGETLLDRIQEPFGQRLKELLSSPESRLGISSRSATASALSSLAALMN